MTLMKTEIVTTAGPTIVNRAIIRLRKSREFKGEIPSHVVGLELLHELGSDWGLCKRGEKVDFGPHNLDNPESIAVDALISGLSVKMAGDNATDLMKNVEKAEFYLMNASYGPELRKIMWDRKQGLG